jgi:hypothetical protein
MLAGKNSNLVAFYKHAACNTEQNYCMLLKRESYWHAVGNGTHINLEAPGNDEQTYMAF